MIIVDYLFYFSLGLSIIIFFVKRDNLRNIFSFFFYLVYSLVVEIIGYYTYDNAWLYNFSTTIDFIFIGFFFRSLILNNRTRRFIEIFIYLYTPFTLTNIFFIQGIYNFHSFSFSIGSLFVIFCAGYKLYELLVVQDPINLIKLPIFWICFGFILFYIGAFQILGLYDLLLKNYRPILSKLYPIVRLLNFMLYLFFSLGFLWAKKTYI